MIRCLLCHLITTWYGNNLEGLKDHSAVQQLVKKSNKVPLANGIVQAKEGQITMYGDEDLTINIVSFAKEKKEIKKALDNAEKKIQQCQEQVYNPEIMCLEISSRFFDGFVFHCLFSTIV